MLRSDSRYPHHEQYKHLSLDAFLDHRTSPGFRLAIARRDICWPSWASTLRPSSKTAVSSWCALGLRRLPRSASTRTWSGACSVQLHLRMAGPEEVPHLNRAQTEAPDVTERQLARLEELTQVDRKLYDWARNRFSASTRTCSANSVCRPKARSPDRGCTTRWVDPRRQVRTSINSSSDLRRQERMSRGRTGRCLK